MDLDQTGEVGELEMFHLVKLFYTMAGRKVHAEEVNAMVDLEVRISPASPLHLPAPPCIPCISQGSGVMDDSVTRWRAMMC